MSKKVIIIGAGIGGMATANLLAQAGFAVEVYEQAPRPGGRAGQYKQDGFTFDTGPSWYLMPSVFERYYKLLGESVDDHLRLTKLSPAYKVFFEHQHPVVITGDLAQDMATFERIEPGAGAALHHYIERSEKIYRLSLRQFLYTTFSRFRDLMRGLSLRQATTMMRLAFTPIHTYVQRFVKDQRLQQILEYPMVFLGSSPFSAPAIYSLMSALDFKEGVYYPQGGIYTIIESLETIGKRAGVQYFYSTPVQKIITKNGKASGIMLQDGSARNADIVISNADLRFTETSLLESKDRSYPQSYWDRKQASPSALMMYLGVQGKLPELRHHNLFFVDAWRDNFDSIFAYKQLPKSASLYVCNPSKTDKTVAPPNNENLFVLVPLPAGVMLDEVQTRQAAKHYSKQIEIMAGISLSDRIVTEKYFGPRDFVAQYNAWEGTMLGQSHKLLQSAIFRTPHRSKRLQNLWYVGANTRPGIGLPMCLISAELVAQQIIGKPYDKDIS